MKNIRVIVKCGKYPGKRVVVLAGVHGNEVCGTKAFDDIIESLRVLRGQVTFIYTNLEAARQNKRFVEANLNRCFFDIQPEDIQGTLEGETARDILPYLREADVLLDLHSSDSSGSQPFILCDINCLKVVFCLFPKIVVLGIDSGKMGSTNGYMSSHKKLGICVECGLHSSLSSVETAKEVIRSILSRFELVDGKTTLFEDKQVYEVKSRYKSKNGAFRLNQPFGNFEFLNETTLIGYDGNEPVYAGEGDSVIFAHNVSGVGEECFTILGRYRWTPDSRLLADR